MHTAGAAEMAQVIPVGLAGFGRYVPEKRLTNFDLEKMVDTSDDWIVQRTSGSAATKPYRCPGCDQLIPPATPHVVAYPADDPSGLENRRHWHTPCWSARDRRAPRGGR